MSPSDEIDTAFPWPWQYDFPPFFTLQPQAETRAKQIETWKSLITNYFKTHRITQLDKREIAEMPLFNNSKINRRLEPAALDMILNEMQSSGNAAPLDKNKNRWEIYWHTLEEFASMIYTYVTNSNLLNTVLTLFELVNSESAAEEAFANLPNDVLIKVLRNMEQNGTCELIMFDDNQGVKFF